jgi:hypothetical protein
MPVFKIELKNNRVKLYRLIAFLLVAISLSLFVFMSLSEKYRIRGTVAFLLLALFVAYELYLQKKNRSYQFFDLYVFIVVACSWIILQNYWIGASSVVLGWMYYISIQQLQFNFEEEFVTKMNFPKVIYPWSDFTNVMIRDGILTLDFKNNKLLQLEVADNVNIVEYEFNVFAKRQLERSSGRRDI